jgi:hypothetical protein
MEISLRYIFIKLDAILPFAFAMIYFIGDANDSQKIEIKDRVSILTGICIAIFYVYKLVKEVGKKDELENIKKRLDELEKNTYS